MFKNDSIFVKAFLSLYSITVSEWIESFIFGEIFTIF
jgi:hypothetical protein